MSVLLLLLDGALFRVNLLVPRETDQVSCLPFVEVLPLLILDSAGDGRARPTSVRLIPLVLNSPDGSGSVSRKAAPRWARSTALTSVSTERHLYG